MNLSEIREVILDESGSSTQLCRALDDFAGLCSEITGVAPDPAFDAWADDSFLDSGVAINPRAAAHCVRDYLRTVSLIRGVNAALDAARSRFPDAPIRILYAGCGPYATLLLPLLEQYPPGELAITLLDVHQRSLDAVSRLLTWFGLGDHDVRTTQADATYYQHGESLHLIITETMQKALEQEPQFAVTANLAPQLCPQGIFVPVKIEVELCLANLVEEQEIFLYSGRLDTRALRDAGKRHSLATVLTLEPGESAAPRCSSGHVRTGAPSEVEPATVVIPALENLDQLDPLLFTRVQVFAHHALQDYEAQITLPRRCPELQPLRAGRRFRVSYAPGNYPKFEFCRLPPDDDPPAPAPLSPSRRQK